MCTVHHVLLSSGKVDCSTPVAPGRLGGHGGGDYLLINAFVQALRVSHDHGLIDLIYTVVLAFEVNGKNDLISPFVRVFEVNVDGYLIKTFVKAFRTMISRPLLRPLG